MEFIIDTAKLDDIEEINNMLTDLIQDERRNYDSNINENYRVQNFYGQFVDNPNVCMLVAKNNGIIVGYVYGFIQDNGNLFYKSVVQVDAIFVKREYRGNGIARNLMKELIKWAQKNGGSYVELSVCKNNIDAMNLYQNEGFEIDKLILKKKL